MVTQQQVTQQQLTPKQEKRCVRSGIRTHAHNIRGPERSLVCRSLQKEMNLESGALDRSAILTTDVRSDQLGKVKKKRRKEEILITQKKKKKQRHKMAVRKTTLSTRSIAQPPPPPLTPLKPQMKVDFV